MGATGATPGPVATGAPRELVVLTAGLRQPSSTRLLADRLSAAVDRRAMALVHLLTGCGAEDAQGFFR